MIDPFYPILPNADWVARLVPLGFRIVQLRLKDASETVIEQQIGQSLLICKSFDCQLVVNDYWRHAIKLKADFIHLGQEDLAAADLDAIRAANPAA